MTTKGLRHPKPMLLAHEMHHGLVRARVAVLELGFRGNLVSAVRTTVGFLKPFLDAVVTENVFALGESKGCLVYPLGVFYAEFVITYNAGLEMSVPANNKRGKIVSSLLFSLSVSSDTSTLCRDAMALLDATRLPGTVPLRSCCARILSSDPIYVGMKPTPWLLATASRNLSVCASCSGSVSSSLDGSELDG